MTVIGTNVSALRATNASVSANKALSTAMERLSTGKRINSAKDDAAGLAISSSMTAQIRGMNQGIRNANDGISMAQTAEGALDEVGNMLQRMRELQVQKLNGTYQDSDTANIGAEQDALAAQIKQIVQTTAFNGKTLFGEDAGDVSIQAGANGDDTVTLSFTDLTADYTPADGDDPAEGSALSTVVSWDDGVLADDVELSSFDLAIAQVANVRASLGASQNRLESAVNNLTSNSTNLADARSRI
jgi:flagellin